MLFKDRVITFGTDISGSGESKKMRQKGGGVEFGDGRTEGIDAIGGEFGTIDGKGGNTIAIHRS